MSNLTQTQINQMDEEEELLNHHQQEEIRKLKEYISYLERENKEISSKFKSKIEKLELENSNRNEQTDFLKNLFFSKPNKNQNQTENEIETELELIKLKKERQFLEIQLEKMGKKVGELEEEVRLKEKESIDLIEEVNKIKSDSLNQIENKILDELMDELDRMKGEKDDLEERFNEIILEKEDQISKLKERIDVMKEEHLLEMGDLVNKIEEIKEELNGNEVNIDINGSDEEFINTHYRRGSNDAAVMNKIMKLEETCKTLSVALNNSKIELKQQESLFNIEKGSFQIKLESVERNYKSHIDELTKLNEDLQREFNFLTNEKNNLSSELKEENKGKDNYKQQYNEILLKNKELESDNNKLKKEVSDLKFEMTIKNTEEYFALLENYKILENKYSLITMKYSEKEESLLLKDKEIGKLKEKVCLLEKESKLNLTNFKKSIKEYKKLSEKLHSTKNMMSDSKGKTNQIEVNDQINEMKKENKKLSRELKELKELYDIQISDLDQKLCYIQIKYNKLFSKNSVQPKQQRFKLRDNLLLNNKLLKSKVSSTLLDKEKTVEVGGGFNSNATIKIRNNEENDKNEEAVQFLKEDNMKLNRKINSMKEEYDEMERSLNERIDELKYLVQKKYM